MPVYTDQLGRNVTVPEKPRRIVSLVPSQTELLADLGLEAEVAGITKFCVHPHTWFRTKQRVGGTKTLHLEKIRSIQPDLIIANKEENVQEQVEALAEEFPVWISDINNLEDSLRMITMLGEVTEQGSRAGRIVQTIRDGFQQLPPFGPSLTACYLIWKNPLMTVGSDTFIHDIMMRTGFENVFAEKRRYPQLTLEEIRAAGPRVLLLSSEPYPFREKHLKEFQTLLPDTSVYLVDGEMFSWYGSRLLKGPAYFLQLRQQIGANP